MSRPDILTFAMSDNWLGVDFLSPAQQTVLKCLYGMPLTEAEQAIYDKHAACPYEGEPYRVVDIIAGRRSGKSLIAAIVGSYEAIHGGHELEAIRGEAVEIPVIAPTMRQGGKIVMGYLRGFFERPGLRGYAVNVLSREIRLHNGITLSVWPCDKRASRGISIPVLVCDEIAFWDIETDSANQDREVLRALSPAMRTFKRSKILKITSAYLAGGVIYEEWLKREETPDVLIWDAESMDMNPALDADEIARDYRDDPEGAAREWGGAVFLSAVSGFFDADAVQANVIAGRMEVPAQEGVAYKAAMDAAFKGDAFIFGLGHEEGGRYVLDVMRAWQGTKIHPVEVDDVLDEIVALRERYSFNQIAADQYAFEPLKQTFAKRGLVVDEHTFTPKLKATIYSKLRNQINARQWDLLDDRALLAEMRTVEIRRTQGGATQIGHPKRGGRDDRPDVLALLADALEGGAPPVACFAGDRKKCGPPQERKSYLATRARERFERRGRGMR